MKFEEKEAKSILLAHIYMNTHYWPGIGNFNQNENALLN